MKNTSISNSTVKCNLRVNHPQAFDILVRVLAIGQDYSPNDLKNDTGMTKQALQKHIEKERRVSK